MHEIEYFNLDAILSVVYRVNSKRSTQFHVWATQTLRGTLLPKLVSCELRVKGRKTRGGGGMKVHIHPHAAARMAERGATEDEVIKTIGTGEQFPAKFG